MIFLTCLLHDYLFRRKRKLRLLKSLDLTRARLRKGAWDFPPLKFERPGDQGSLASPEKKRRKNDDGEENQRNHDKSSVRVPSRFQDKLGFPAQRRGKKDSQGAQRTKFHCTGLMDLLMKRRKLTVLGPSNCTEIEMKGWRVGTYEAVLLLYVKEAAHAEQNHIGLGLQIKRKVGHNQRAESKTGNEVSLDVLRRRKWRRTKKKKKRQRKKVEKNQ